MKKPVFLMLTVLMIACNPTVVFTEPQPQGKHDLRVFPARYRGTYMEKDDSTIYLLKAERILQKYEEYLNEPEEEILKDGEIELSGNNLVIKDMNMKFPVTRRNDSVFGKIVVYDTIFDILGEGKLRKSGKNYFLNLRSDSLWVVFKLVFDRSGRAYLCDVDRDRELELFRQYCRVDEETDQDGKPVKYLLTPTAGELKKIIKLGSFTDTTEYIRISSDYQGSSEN
jgi:hypothetical protein